MAFQFSSRITIQIEGKHYIIDTTKEELMQAFQELAEQSISLSKQSLDEENIESQGKNLCNLCQKFVDDVLGDGSFAAIFEGRVINVEDAVDLTCYLCNEVKRVKEQRLSRFNQLQV